VTLTVCIPTAGRGTRMGDYSSYINKSLLPINKKAVISHIISQFPEGTEFVIALGEKSEQVKNYLTLAHPETIFHFVLVDNFDRQGSGPGYSLLCCRSKLEKPFFFVSCDTLWKGNFLNTNFNWLGVSKVHGDLSNQFCNVETDPKTKNIKGFHDKKKVSGEHYRTFTGLCFIKDFKQFWEGLEEPEYISGEHQISSGLNRLLETKSINSIEIEWDDVGNIENYRRVMSKYEPYDFSKTNEFIYIQKGQVLKFFADEKIVKRRVQKANMNTSVFPIIKKHKSQFYSYEFSSGKTLYEENSNQILQDLLEWLDLKLWHEYKCSKMDMKSICKKFYKDKTLSRTKLFEEKYPGFDKACIINGKSVPSLSTLMGLIPWEILYDGIPRFIHGDLQFDNILYDQTNCKFLLLDWRQDFGGQIEFGDIYYDYAKLNGGMLLNYDYIKANLLKYKENDKEISFDFAQRQSLKIFEEILYNFIRDKGHNPYKVRLLVPIIFLNMSPLHHYPFDKMLHVLGRQILSDLLCT
jgi:NDP-sugar pyrophosphorylase family protein